jgi:ubiquitin-conjugating enzyme E2 Q
MPKARKAKDPPWSAVRGVKRVVSEYAALAAAIADGESSLCDLSLVDERDACVWRLRMRDFDTSTRGGAALNADLRELVARYASSDPSVTDAVTLEVRFPYAAYPNEPPFVRVVSPRARWYTGHVTAGGSVCVEVLAPHAWRPEFSVASVLETLKHAFVSVEPAVIKTRFGPGGVAGPLRVDLEQTHCSSPIAEYSEREARAAFERSLDHHARNGW